MVTQTVPPILKHNLVVSSICEKGPVRPTNADAIQTDPNIGLFALADGVGSEPQSSEGSRIAVAQAHEEFEKTLSQTNEVPPLKEYMQSVIEAYHAHFNHEPDMPKTTLSVAYFSIDSLFYSNIGDSPILLIQDNQITLLTANHTVVDRFKSFTDFSLMKSFSGSNILFNYLGLREAFPNTYKPVNLVPPYFVLLASDGVFNFLSQDDLLEISKKCVAPSEFTERVSAAALRSIPTDNYSLIVVAPNL